MEYLCDILLDSDVIITVTVCFLIYIHLREGW